MVAPGATGHKSKFRTLRRQLGFSLEIKSFLHIQNSELDVIVGEELRAFPRTGETNVIAGLRQRGLTCRGGEVAL